MQTVRNLPLLLLFLLCSLHTYAQVRVEQGYIVSYDDDTLSCWIKNEGWRKSPSSISIRRMASGPEEQVSCREVKAFGIGKEVLYRAEYVKLDVSSVSSGFLSMEREPEWKSDTLFLEQLVGGMASLYVYRMKGFNKFYFQVLNDPVEPLIFKKYQKINTPVQENRDFVFQLSKALQCGKTTLVDVENLAYDEKQLVAVFESYNACNGVIAVKHNVGSKNIVHLRVLTGLDIQRYTLVPVSPVAANYENLPVRYQPTLRLGLEAEFFLAFKRKNWAITGEAGLNYFRNSVGIPSWQPSRFEGDMFIRYQSIETLFGLRRYFTLPQNTRLFASGFGLLDFEVNSSIIIGEFTAEPVLKGAYSWGFGVGVRRGKFGAEVRIYDYRSILLFAPVEWDQRLSKTSLVVSYRLF